ncbi:MAG TPA: YfiR family protein [Usitatibacter sp.]|nr:YfiR family protein [Usitatibacter sp.]
MDALTARLRPALLGAALTMLSCMAQAQQASEAAVKAAFLYKFPGYIEWPAESFPTTETPFVIGVVGADEVAVELEKLVPGRAIGARRIAIRRLREGDSPRGVHILFIGRLDAAATRTLVRTAHAHLGTLTVTESERGLEMGAAINFVAYEDRVAFEVSLDNAERTGLRISSRMLAVARRVVPRG